MLFFGVWSSFEASVILLLSCILIVLAEKEERAGHKSSQWQAGVGYLGMCAAFWQFWFLYHANSG